MRRRRRGRGRGRQLADPPPVDGRQAQRQDLKEERDAIIGIAVEIEDVRDGPTDVPTDDPNEQAEATAVMFGKSAMHNDDGR